MLPRRKKPKRLIGDNPLFRARYQELFGEAPVNPEAYAFWLRTIGVDPDTGRMTAEAFSLYKELLAAHEARRRKSP